MRKLLLAIGVAFCCQTAALADPLPAGSTWQNQRGSLLNVGAVRGNGSFRGTYINNAPGFQCQGTPYPAIGRTSSAKTVFRVKFTQCQSVTTWTGTVNGPYMPTSWILIHNGQKQTGQDYFYRTN